MAATTTLDEVGGVIGRRLKELEPVMQEFRQLEAARDALDKVIVSPATSNSTKRTSGARGAKPARTRTKPAVKRGRPQGSGSRDREVVNALMKAGPEKGLTVSEIAARIGIKPNYLYRVVKRLKSEGRVTSRVHGHQTRYYHVSGSA